MIIVGKKYSNWTVIKFSHVKNKKHIYICRCNCGFIKEVRNDQLKSSRYSFCERCRYEKIKIKTGDKFGKWTVLKEIETKEKGKHYEVQCECGTLRILKGIRLRFGDSLKCRKCGSKKHGLVHSRTYSTWESMIQRCTNKNNRNYRHYGGRGIAVCERWKKFENFFQDMGKRPNKLQLDRINNNGNYEPSNCRWVTQK